MLGGEFVVSDFVIEERLGSFHKDLGGRFAGVHGNEFEPCPLLVVKFYVHGSTLIGGVIWLSMKLW
jgi:hypothetical protein